MKTSELIGPALDWAVVIAKGVRPADIRVTKGRIYRWSRDNDGRLTGSYMTGPEFLPSSMWGSGGPIIEREGVQLHVTESRAEWIGSCWGYSGQQYGPTPLIAAMRCYVASKLGDEVDIPKELT